LTVGAKGLFKQKKRNWMRFLFFSWMTIKPRLPDSLKTPPDLGQQETRLCARFGWYRHVPCVIFFRKRDLPPFGPKSKDE